MKNFVYIFVFFVSCIHATAQTKHVHLCSKTNGGIMLNTGDLVTFWGYGYYTSGGPNKITLPAPLLEFNLNDSVYIHFHNLSPEGHTIHLHGLDVDMMNDGSPHTTGQVNTNDSTTYFFVAKHPGSFLYHCHVMSVHHVALGMSGMIVVKNLPDTTVLYNGGVGFNKRYAYLSTDFDIDWNLNPVFPGPMNMYRASYFMLNGKSGSQIVADSNMVIQANANDSICLHLGNLGYTSSRYAFPAALNAKVYMSDGRALPNAYAIDTLQVFPGERYEVILKPATAFSGHITVTYHDAVLNYVLGTNYIGVNNYALPVGFENITPVTSPVLFPNPAHELLFFEPLNSAQGLLKIFDLNGKLMLEKKLNPQDYAIDISVLDRGAYILEIVGGGNSHRAKFIKQ